MKMKLKSKNDTLFNSLLEKHTRTKWCDVVPVDACHLLLTKPWQFDRQIMYDGHKNTYCFFKDRKRHCQVCEVVQRVI